LFIKIASMPKRIEGLQERLVDELETLLFDEGAEITLRALAGRVGVAVGTIYNYFPNKSDLLKALFRKEWSAVVRRADLALKESASSREKLLLLVQNIYQDGERITGTFPKRRAFMLQPEGLKKFKELKEFPYPFSAEGLGWLCDTFHPLWRDHFKLHGREADLLTILLVSVIPRLQMRYPRSPEENIHFLTGLIEKRMESCGDA
jgi:AcrR family transcriptional regulator